MTDRRLLLLCCTVACLLVAGLLSTAPAEAKRDKPGIDPVACPDVWDPVCGADGQTYSNSCYALNYGQTSVACEGTCPCGGSTALPDEETAAPNVCPDLWAPVCGDNGRTYPNQWCMPRNVGVECTGECPCITSIASREAGASLDPVGTGDALTTPEPEAQANFCPKIWAPVCGSNGKTYPNQYCVPGGVSVECSGECPCV